MSFRRSRRPDDWPTLHDRARAALSDQMDGVLDAGESAWLDAHLAGCPHCRIAADDYAAQRFELRGLRDRQPLPPRDLWARTAAAIETEAAGRSTAGRGVPRRLLLGPSAFIATALVVAVASGLLTSSQRPAGGGGGGSSQAVAVASATASTRDVALGPTPIPVPTKNVEILTRTDQGTFKLTTKKVDKVCPKGSTQPCDTTSSVEDRTVTIDQDAQAVYGSTDEKRLIVMSSPTTDDPPSVSVIALADEPATPSSSPSATPSSSPPAPSPTPAETPTSTPSTDASSAPPSETPSDSPTPTPSVTATPTGSIDVTPPGSGDTIEIARGVVLVGQTASYSSSGDWFAFTARPIDGSAGPDIYVWRVGTAAARKVTDGGRSVFGSWVRDQLVGSTAVDASGSGKEAKAGLQGASFFLDPATGARVDLPQAGSSWRPAVSPKEFRAVYWTGTIRAVDGPGYAPESGKLVLGDWTHLDATASGAPTGTPPAGDQSKERREATIAAGRMDDWDAAWDPTGTYLAVWIADHQNPAVGRLSLYAVDGFDGTIDVKAPLLDSQMALAGFSISEGQLIWAQPSRDGSTAKGLQLLAWTPDGIGQVQTYDGPAIVIR